MRGAFRALCSLLIASPCLAQPVGSEFRVNDFTFADVTYPAVGVGSDGFFVVWEAWWNESSRDLYAARFDAVGAEHGSPFRVNTYATGFQSRPSVAVLSTGGGIVVWSSERDGSGTGIYAQRFHAGGGKIGGEFRVNTWTSGIQDYPAVALLGAGAVVVWWSVDQDGDGFGVFGQRFTSSGAKGGPEFRVNAYTTGDQLFPAVAAVDGGGFVVVWSDGGRDSGTSGVWAARYDDKGEPLGKEFRVNTYTTYGQWQPAAATIDGGFVVVWRGSGPGDIAGIFGRRFDAVDGPLGAQFRVNTTTTGTQASDAHAVASRPGEFAVVWEDTAVGGAGDGSDRGVFAQAFKSTGAPVGPEFRVNTYTTGAQENPAIAGAAGVPFLVVWESAQHPTPGFTAAVMGQRFEPGGVMPGDVNADGLCNVTDVLFLINHLFAGGPIPPGDGDPNNDTVCNVTDVLYLINYLFAGGPAPV